MNIRRLLFSLLLTSSLPFFAFSQWTTCNNGSPFKRAVLQLSAESNTYVWGTLTDANYEEYIKELVVTGDGGNTWSTRLINITGNYQVNAVTASPLDPFHVWVVLESDTSGGCIAYSSNSGVDWTKQDSATFHNNPVWIHFWNDTTGLVVGNPVDGRFEIFTTTTGGLDWEKVPAMNIPVSLDDEFALTNSFLVKGDTVFFGGVTYGKIFTSPDKGKSWSYLPFPLDNIKKVIFMDSTTLIAGTPGLADLSWDLFITYDWGQHWTVLPSEGPAYTSDICKVPGTDSVLISAGVGLSYSNNFGKNWTNFIGPTTNPSPYYNTVLFYDLTHAWAGGVNPTEGIGGISKYNGPAMFVNELIFNELNLNVFPNPCTDILHLQVVGNSHQSIPYSIFDISGRIILKGNINNTGLPFTTDVNVSSLSPGAYLLQLQAEGSSIQKELIVR